MPPPIWLMRQAGRYLPEYRALRNKAPDFLGFCYAPELASEATLQPIRRFGLDGAILFSDILVIPDALGQTVHFRQGEGPILEALDGDADIAALDPGRTRRHLAPVYETVAAVGATLPAEVALIGFAGGPWTVATYMIEGRGGTDMMRTRRWARETPASFATLIEALVEATTEHLLAQIEAGAEVVQIFDTWAGVLAETQFDRWVVEPTRRIVEDIKAARPGVPVIGFPRGCGTLYESYVRTTGIDGVGIDAGVPARWAADVLQPACAVQGNLDNLALRAGGAVLEAEARRILATLGNGAFVFNLGHGVLPDTPFENVARLVELVRGAGAP